MSVCKKEIGQRQDGFSKFIRIGKAIILTEGNEIYVSHEILAKNNKINVEKLKWLIKEKPNLVDGGIIIFYNPPHGKPILTIKLESSSHALGVPTNEEVRKETVRIFKAKARGYDVRCVRKLNSKN
jgi:hypothetical protein